MSDFEAEFDGFEEQQPGQEPVEAPKKKKKTKKKTATEGTDAEGAPKKTKKKTTSKKAGKKTTDESKPAADDDFANFEVAEETAPATTHTASSPTDLFSAVSTGSAAKPSSAASPDLLAYGFGAPTSQTKSKAVGLDMDSLVAAPSSSKGKSRSTEDDEPLFDIIGTNSHAKSNIAQPEAAEEETNVDAIDAAMANLNALTVDKNGPVKKGKAKTKENKPTLNQLSSSTTFGFVSAPTATGPANPSAGYGAPNPAAGGYGFQAGPAAGGYGANPYGFGGPAASGYNAGYGAGAFGGYGAGPAATGPTGSKPKGNDAFSNLNIWG